MKPAFLCQMEEAFAVGQAVILSLNTEDRFFFPENNLPPVYLPYFLARYFHRRDYRIAYYMPASGAVELTPDATHDLKELRGEETIQVLKNIARLLHRSNERWLVILAYGEHISGPNSNNDILAL